MAIPVATPKALLADKGYDGDRFRESLLVRGILPIIPPRSNRKVPEHPDYRRYKDRNRVERMFSKLKQQRRIATRYDKTLLSFESFLNLAAMLRRDALMIKSYRHGLRGLKKALCAVRIFLKVHSNSSRSTAGVDKWRPIPAVTVPPRP